MELGGKSALLVFDDADVEKAVEWCMVSPDACPILLSVCLYLCLFVCLSNCLSVPIVCLSVQLPITVCPSVCLRACLALSVPVCFRAAPVHVCAACFSPGLLAVLCCSACNLASPLPDMSTSEQIVNPTPTCEQVVVLSPDTGMPCAAVRAPRQDRSYSLAQPVLATCMTCADSVPPYTHYATSSWKGLCAVTTQPLSCSGLALLACCASPLQSLHKHLIHCPYQPFCYHLLRGAVWGVLDKRPDLQLDLTASGARGHCRCLLQAAEEARRVHQAVQSPDRGLPHGACGQPGPAGQDHGLHPGVHHLPCPLWQCLSAYISGCLSISLPAYQPAC